MPVDMYVKDNLFVDGISIADISDADFTPKYETNIPYKLSGNLNSNNSIDLSIDGDFDIGRIFANQYF